MQGVMASMFLQNLDQPPDHPPPPAVVNAVVGSALADQLAAVAPQRKGAPPLKDSPKSFKNGDQVVLPPYGVGIVSGTTTKTVAGADHKYYEVQFPNGTSRAYVPVNAPLEAGLRPALTGEEVQAVLERLAHGRITLPKQWAARHRKVTDILTSGDPYQIATLASELRRWDLERGLPDLDRQAYRRALRLLAGEISAVLDISPQDARQMMDAGDEDDLN
jgi:CarD family transcriptional regulator